MFRYIAVVFIAILCAPLAGFAQSIALNPNPSIVYGFADNNYFSAQIVPYNTTNQTVVASLHAPVLDYTYGTYNYFCWDDCYTPHVRLTPVGSLVTIPALQQGQQLDAHYDPQGLSGKTTVWYTFANTKDPENDFVETTVTFVSLMPKIQGSATICPGEANTLSLEQAVFDRYLWSTGDSTASIDVSTAGTYTVSVTFAYAPSAFDARTAEFTVVDGTSLSPTVAGELAYCAGDSTDLSAGIGYDTYAWNNGQTTPTIAATAGTYTVTVTKGNCVGEQTVAVVENPLPPKPAITARFDPDPYSDPVYLESLDEATAYRWYREEELIFFQEGSQLVPREKVPHLLRTMNEFGCLSPLSDPYTPFNLSTVDIREPENIQVFPNPAADQITIQISTSFQSGQLLLNNTLGQTVRQINLLPNSQNTISVQNLDAGLYIYFMQLDGHALAGKPLMITH